MLKENDKEPLISTKLGSLLQEGNFKLIEKQEKGLQYSKWQISVYITQLCQSF